MSHRAVLVSVGLALANALVYGQMITFDFTNYDDPRMILDNPIVRNGLTWAGLRWALTTSAIEYWHPLTWLSHMLDCQLFGLKAGWHHLMSLGLHLANTLLLFASLQRMTGALARSAVVAAIFGLHPLHVEPVAWIAERKELLAAFFWLLSIWAYARHVQKSEGVGRRSENETPRSYLQTLISGFSWLALGFYVLSLMSKPMAVTLPFVLLLLDFWPLRRVTVQSLRSRMGRLILEKLPFFGLTLASCVITIFGVRVGEKVLSTEVYPLMHRLIHVPIAYARYLGKTIWPADLSPFYPRTGDWALWELTLGILIIFAISVFVGKRARTAPYLVFGWLMFLGTLVPTLGIVAVGYQAIADRYTYLPSIGLFVALVWIVSQVSLRWKSRIVLLRVTVSLVLLACAFLSWVQVQYWRNSIDLWTHSLAVTSRNDVAHNNLGWALLRAGRLNEAEEQFREVLRISPVYLDGHISLGNALAAGGRYAEATDCFTTALRINPNYAKAHEHLGLALIELGDLSGASAHFKEALRLSPDDVWAITGMARVLSAQEKPDQAMYYYSEALRRDPDFAQAHYRLGLDWFRRGRLDEAVASFSEVIRIDPFSSDAHYQLAVVLARQRKFIEAAAHIREALRLKPDSPALLNNVAWVLATHPASEFRNGIEAVKLAERACILSSYKQAVFIGTLAVAYAEAGHFDQALETSRMAGELASSLGQTNLAKRNQELLEQFKKRVPFHEE